MESTGNIKKMTMFALNKPILLRRCDATSLMLDAVVKEPLLKGFGKKLCSIIRTNSLKLWKENFSISGVDVRNASIKLTIAFLKEMLQQLECLRLMNHEMNPSATWEIINNGQKESCTTGRWNGEWTPYVDMNQLKTMGRGMRTFSECEPWLFGSWTNIT